VDLRQAGFEENTFDCILAAAVLHHLREESDWVEVFANLHRWLKPGGRLYVSDLVIFDNPEVQAVLWRRYGRHLEAMGGVAMREWIFDYIDREDSPRSLPFQFDMLRRAGFQDFDVLHRNGVGACYYARK
jgi:tRNA (cmo5U34)-methyltransferase